MISLHFCSIPILQFINSLCQEEVTIMPNTYQAEFNLDLIWYWDDEASRRISGGWFLCRRGRKSASRERSGGTASRRGCQRSRGCRQWRHQCLVVWNHEMETYVGLEQESTEQIDNDENIEATLDDSSGSASRDLEMFLARLTHGDAYTRSQRVYIWYLNRACLGRQSSGFYQHSQASLFSRLIDGMKTRHLF